MDFDFEIKCLFGMYHSKINFLFEFVPSSTHLHNITIVRHVPYSDPPLIWNKGY